MARAGPLVELGQGRISVSRLSLSVCASCTGLWLQPARAFNLHRRAAFLYWIPVELSCFSISQLKVNQRSIAEKISSRCNTTERVQNCDTEQEPVERAETLLFWAEMSPLFDPCTGSGLPVLGYTADPRPAG